MKIYIKSKKDNTYLFPFYYENNWVDNISDAFAFEVISLEHINIKDIVPDTIYQQKNELVAVCLIDGVEKEIIKKSKVTEIISYTEFLQLKKNFNSFEKKDFVHYVIYSYIKGQDPYISVKFSNSKKMKNTFFKIKRCKFLISNYTYTIDYLIEPFEKITKKKFKKILELILKEI